MVACIFTCKIGLHTQSHQIRSLALKNIPDLNHQFLLPIWKVQIVMASTLLSYTETLRRAPFLCKLSSYIDSWLVISFIKFPTMLQFVGPDASCLVTYVMAMFNGKCSFLLNNGRYVPSKKSNPAIWFCFKHTNSEEQTLGDNSWTFLWERQVAFSERCLEPRESKCEEAYSQQGK